MTFEKKDHTVQITTLRALSFASLLAFSAGCVRTAESNRTDTISILAARENKEEYWPDKELFVINPKLTNSENSSKQNFHDENERKKSEQEFSNRGLEGLEGRQRQVYSTCFPVSTMGFSSPICN